MNLRTSELRNARTTQLPHYGRETGMGFHLRKRVRFGPVQLNISNRSWPSVTLRFRRLSWNSRTRRFTFDTSGPGYWQQGK